jgi:hypothetical protein
MWAKQWYTADGNIKRQGDHATSGGANDEKHAKKIKSYHLAK